MLRAFRSILLSLVAVSLGSVDLWSRPVSCVSGTADTLVVRECSDTHDVILETFYVKAFEGYLMENGTRIP